MNDKTQHFIAGFLLSILGLIWTPLILLGFIFGIGKEAYDYISGKGVAEWADMAYTFYGAILALIIVLGAITL
jgi:hypothetical protein